MHWATLQLGGHEIQVWVIENLKLDGDDAYGYFDESQMTISICGGIPQTLFWETLIHECIHAVMALYGLHSHLKSTEDDADEPLAALIGTGLYQMLKPFIGAPRE